MTTRLLNATLLVLCCLLVVPAARSYKLQAAQGMAAQENPLASTSVREVLGTLSPVQAEAMRRMEFENGVTFTDEKIFGTATTTDYQKMVERVRAEFCGQERNLAARDCRGSTLPE